MLPIQPGILADVPRVARHVNFHAVPGADVAAALARLRPLIGGTQAVLGLGAALVSALGARIPGLRDFPAAVANGIEVPSTPAALWCWLRGEDTGELIHRQRRIEAALGAAFRVDAVIDAFRHAGGRDLTGYEDGTENPDGEEAAEAVAMRAAGAGLDGSSIVAVQRWVHDLDRFAAMSPEVQDLTIGRRRSDNEEIDDAPPTAHVKRTEQESFEPPAFVLRRSMPWADAHRSGLVFVAFGHSPEAFERQLARMTGADDGIVDALFGFTQPVSGAYFWCPPVHDDGLDLSAVGLGV